MNFSIPFMRFRKITGLSSIAIFILAIFSLSFKGLNLGLDFSGGTLVEVAFEETIPLEDIRNNLAANGSGGEPYNTNSDIDILSNGFKLRGGSSSFNNYLTETYIFIAFAETPFKYANAR